jgi:mannosyltransferase
VTTGFALRKGSSPRPPARRRGYVLGAVAVTALALAIRFSTLSLQSFWLDEAYTEHLVHLGFGAMLDQIPRTESTPPFYYVLAWGWTRLFGYSEFGLRSLSALAGGLTVTLGYLLAGRLAGVRAAVIAGLLLAVSPLMVWYSQEARAYALAALLSVASIVALLRYTDSQDRRWLWAWAASAALGLCTHYFFVFILLAELAWLCVRHRDRTEVRAAGAFVILVGCALVPLALAQRGTGHADYIAHNDLGTRLLQVPKQFLIGYASPAQAITGPLAAAIVLLGALWPLFRARARLGRPVFLVLATGLCVVVIPSLLAVLGVDFLDTRNLLVGLPLLLAVAAVGFEGGPRSPARPWAAGFLAGFLAALFAVVVILVDTHVQDQRPDWRGAADALGTAAVPRALVVSPGSGLLALELYLPRVGLLAPQQPVREIDVIALPAQRADGGLANPPHPRSPPPVPAGFFLISASYKRAFTVLRYRSAREVTVTPGGLSASGLEPGTVATFFQPAVAARR